MNVDGMAPGFPHIPADTATRPFKMCRLADGRDLAFTEWGDSAGFPAFYFHGTPSSRLEGAFADAAAKAQGVRLIAVDRPGFGHSTFQPKRKFRNWPGDVLALADHLGLDRFGVVGHSGAGPHLFACGAFIDPARLCFVGALGPFGPVSSPEMVSSLNALDRFYFRLSRRLSPGLWWIMRATFAPLGWSARWWPHLFFAIMKATVSQPDKHALDHPPLLKAFIDIEREAFRQGSKGAAYEAMICYQPWDFDLADIRVPTVIWLGREDIFVSNAMGRHLARTIPDVTFHLVPGKGHFNIENWADILSACMTTHHSSMMPV